LKPFHKQMNSLMIVFAIAATFVLVHAAPVNHSPSSGSSSTKEVPSVELEARSSGLFSTVARKKKKDEAAEEKG
jgi:hypothetical protein